MTNASIQQRFGIKPNNAAQAPPMIQTAVKDGAIRLFDPESRDRDRSYVPFWA